MKPERPERAGVPWTTREIRFVQEAFANDQSNNEIAEIVKRTSGAICSFRKQVINDQVSQYF